LNATTNRHSSVVTIAALFYVLLWSSGFIAAKICVRYSPPMILLSVRFLLATVLMWAAARWIGASFPTTRFGWLRLAAIGVLNMAAPMGFNFVALRQVSAGTAAIAAATNPLLLALLAPKLLGERMTPQRAVGLFLGFGGVVVVMTARVGAGGRSDSPLGVVLLLANVVSLVAATVLLKRSPPRESLIVINAVQMLVSGVLLLVPAIAFEHVGDIRFTAAFVGSFVYLLFVLSIGASLLWFWLLSRGEASVASSYLFLTPLLGLLLAWVFLGEAFTLRDGMGLLATMAGIALIRR
jgi:drug/metabolite transporter (DMT)-like permease